MTLYEEWTSPEGMKQVKQWIAEGLTAKQIAEEKIYINESTIKKWKSKNADFAALFPKRAKRYKTDGKQAKEYLNRCKDDWNEQVRQIERLNDSRLEAINRATSTTARLNPVRVQTSRRCDKLERCVIDATTLENKIKSLVQQLHDEKVEVKRHIDRMGDPLYIHILTSVFIQGKSFYSMTGERNLETRDKAKGKMKNALKEFEAVNPNLFG